MCTVIARHPWLALGAAAAAGFAGGMAFNSGRRRNSRGASPDWQDDFNGQAQSERVRPSRWSSLVPWEMLIGPITELVRTLVENLFAAFIASRVATQEAAAPSRGTASADSNAPHANSSSDAASPLDDPIVEQAIEA